MNWIKRIIKSHVDSVINDRISELDNNLQNKITDTRVHLNKHIVSVWSDTSSKLIDHLKTYHLHGIPFKKNNKVPVETDNTSPTT